MAVASACALCKVCPLALPLGKVSSISEPRTTAADATVVFLLSEADCFSFTFEIIQLAVTMQMTIVLLKSDSYKNFEK